MRAKVGAPDRIRTCGLQLRRLSLYPAELRAHAARCRDFESEKLEREHALRLPTLDFRTCDLSTCDLVRPAGLEPAAYWFEASRSIQLSYGRALATKNHSTCRCSRPPLPRSAPASTAMQPFSHASRVSCPHPPRTNRSPRDAGSITAARLAPAKCRSAVIVPNFDSCSSSRSSKPGGHVDETEIDLNRVAAVDRRCPARGRGTTRRDS